MSNIVESKNYTYFELKSAIYTLAESYPFVRVSSVGKSVLGKELLTLSVGKGKESVLLCGAFHGSEAMTATLILSFAERLFAALEGDGIRIKKPVCAVPDVVNITLPRIKSETMLNFLSGKGICASAGSACSAGSGRLSSALRAFGCPDDVIDSSLRISLSYTNTEEDIDALCKALAEGAVSLQKF